MGVGRQHWDNAGNLVFDLEALLGGMTLEIYREGGSGAVHTFPLFLGRSAELYLSAGRQNVAPVVDYTLGYPRITYGAAGAFPATWLAVAF